MFYLFNYCRRHQLLQRLGREDTISLGERTQIFKITDDLILEI